ncbi:MAG: HmuY family protein [Bacteroidia bacterium]|nr:HmuY family protein [Bacteroidia bacterium]
MRRIYLYLIIILFLFTACLKEEIPLPKHVAGNIKTMVINIGYPYLNQVYYNCETNSIVKTNTKYDWDISFECTETGYHVMLNNATGMLAANMGNKTFNEVNSTANAVWLWDAPSGNLDSTALGNWQNNNPVYILDRQYDDNGNHLGYKKIQILNTTATSYTFKYADLNGNNENTYTIQKNTEVNFIHFSFNNGGKTLLLEPQKNAWDLLFTNHIHKFSNLTMPFVLTQCLTNKYNGVVVAEDNNNKFQSITLKDTASYVFTNYLDEIGSDWKIRNNADNSFTIDPKKSFIIKSTHGFFYKLRFTSFYNSSGEKGYPTFEIQKL